MSATTKSIISEAETTVLNYLQENLESEYVFHDINHTTEVVEAVQEIADGYELNEEEKEILMLAAWFHDTGYRNGPNEHERRSCAFARDFLSENEYPKEKTEQVCECIMATQTPQQPNSLIAEILCDADLSHLGKKTYWDRCGKIRQELLMTKSVMMTEQEWVDFELNFLSNHRYHTTYAQELYNKRKHKHIRQLLKQKLRLNPTGVDPTEMPQQREEEKRKKKAKVKKKKPDDLELKELRLGRGVETMYRTAYRTHVNLSAIADNKANIMLSINAIIISIVVSTLVPQFDTSTKLILPTIVLLSVCLVSMVFATLSTRPKVTEGKVSREDIEQKNTNLLFFGNFYRMPLEDFDWGMKEMIKDSDFLYSTMTRDLYYLGIVLAKKYRYLSHCYNVFMYGLILSVVFFALSYLT